MARDADAAGRQPPRFAFWPAERSREKVIGWGRPMQRSASMTPPELVRRGTLAALSLLLSGLLTAEAHAQSTIAGNYEPSPQRMEVKVSTWGEDCGTRPTDHVINETGKVSVKEEGAHLSMKFATRTL